MVELMVVKMVGVGVVVTKFVCRLGRHWSFKLIGR